MRLTFKIAQKSYFASFLSTSFTFIVEKSTLKKHAFSLINALPLATYDVISLNHSN